MGFLVGSSGGKDSNLLGQHTVRMSPIGTAQLNPYAESFCLTSPGHSVLVPILLNNTAPSSVRYSLTPLGYVQDPGVEVPKGSLQKVDYMDLSAKELKSIEQSRLEGLQVSRSAVSKKETEDYDDYDDEEEEDSTSSKHSSSLQKTQGVAHIRVSKPGVIRLERVLDTSNVEARLVWPNEVTVAPCPAASFSPKNDVGGPDDIRCAAPGMLRGGGEEVQFAIDINGVPPLSLRWSREAMGRKESFMVEGIEDPNSARTHSSAQAPNTPSQVIVPLTVTLDALGTHAYVLESVTDAFGNTVSLGGSHDTPEHDSKSLQKKYRRSVTVLRRPVVSFRNCVPTRPASLSIGADTPLIIGATELDNADAPWEVGIKYLPPVDEDSKASKKKYKAWTKRLMAQDVKRELTLRANAPGQYMISDVKGLYCEGDVLSPDTCKVVERPLPTAEIEWKKIHEWFVYP